MIEDIERETKDDRSQWKEIGEGLTDATKSVATALRDARAEAEGKPSATSPPAVNGASEVTANGASPADTKASVTPEAAASDTAAVPATAEAAPASNGAAPAAHEPAPTDEAAR